MEVARAATIIGRPPSTLAHKARELGLTLPRDWYELIAPEYAPKLKGIQADEMSSQYPYVSIKSDERDDLLAVNEFVPKNYPEWMRADICQEILMEIYEGKLSLETLGGSTGSQLIRKFIARWRKQNTENGGYNVIYGGDLDDDRTFDELAGAKALQDMPYNAMNDFRRTKEAYIGYVEPDQLNYVFQKEIDAKHESLYAAGMSLRRKEVREMMEAE
jgi:hypothetical protein